MFRRNLKIAFRKLARRKEFTIINTFGLVVGVTTSLFIFLWINDELNFETFHENKENIYGVWGHHHYDNGDITTGNDQTGSLKEVFDNDFPEVEKAARMSFNSEVQLSIGEKRFRKKGILADEEFFQIFSFPFIDGQLNESSLATATDIILTESLAMNLFGRTNVTGEQVRVDNQVDAIVRGVVKDPPPNSRFQFDYAMSMQEWIGRNSWAMGWGNGAMEVYLALREGTDVDQFNSKIEGVIKKNMDNSIKSLFVKPLTEMYLHGDYENGQQAGGRIEYVRLFSIVGIFIIVIACINFINLSIADSFKRAKEVGVKKVVGSGKAALLKEFLLQSGLIVVISFVVGVILVEILMPTFNELTGKSISLNRLSPSMIISILGMIALITLLAGLYPGIVLSRFKTIEALKGKIDRRGASSAGLIIRKGLVVFQFLVAGFLIFATLIIGRQIDFIFNNDRNVEKDGMIVMNNHYDLIENYESFRAELLKDPSIEAVTSIGQLPINITSTSGDPTWEGKDPQVDKNSFRLFFTEQDFVTTMKLELLQGRNFSRELESDSTSIILNEAAVRGMNIEDPINMIVKFWGMDARVIGVVKDFHLNSVYEEIEPLIIINWAENTEYVTVRAAQGQEARALDVMEETYARFMPGHIFDYYFMQDSHERMYKSELIVKDLARIFGIIAIFISCLGLFGLTSIQAERNVKEIGVRKVLGASVSQILLRFSRQSLVLPGLAAILMMPLAYFLMKGWLENFRYHIDIQTWSLGAVVLVSLAIAWLTVSFIAFRAARKNPVNSLRSE